MANVKEDYGINDPNLLAILGGIDDPTKLAALSESNNGIGGVLVPGLQRRHDAQVRNALQMLAGNNLARASLHERQQDITRAKDEETHFSNMADKLNGLVSAGILPSDYLPYRRLLAPGSTGSTGSIGIATLLAQQGKKAWNNNQLAEAYNRLDEAGYNIGEGGIIDPNNPNMPRMTKGPARRILQELARAQANAGKVKSIYGADDSLIQSEVTLPSGVEPPKSLSELTRPGTLREVSPSKTAEQKIRADLSLRIKGLPPNAPIGRRTDGSYTLTYSGADGKQYVVIIPSDPSNRPLTEKATMSE